MKSVALFLAGMMVVGACPLNAQNVVTGFGDSITYGYGSSQGYTQDNDSAWFGRLRHMMGATTHNYGRPGAILFVEDPSWPGVNGGNLVDMVPVGLSANPTTGYVTIMIGSNDCGHVPDMGQWKATYKSEVQSLIAAGYLASKIVLISPPWSPSMNTSVFQAPVQQVASELNTLYADAYTATYNHPEWFADWVHPNNLGHTVIANLVYSTLSVVSAPLPVHFKSLKITKKLKAS